MSDEFERPSRPPFPDESWWERELFKNQKFMDKYMAVSGDTPDLKILDALAQNEIDPLEEEEIEDLEEELESDSPGEATPDAPWGDEEEEEDFEEDTAENQSYGQIASLSRRFCWALYEVRDLPDGYDILILSAAQIGAHLAGGHGIGYDEESICGNIVKCRWALADCEFCREMLDHLIERKERGDLAPLRREAIELVFAIRRRIEALRARVWW